MGLDDIIVADGVKRLVACIVAVDIYIVLAECVKSDIIVCGVEEHDYLLQLAVPVKTEADYSLRKMVEELHISADVLSCEHSQCGMCLSELDKSLVVIENISELGLSVPFKAVYRIGRIVAVVVVCAAGERL